MYDSMVGRGISSTIDYALSVKKPLGISDSYMFRNIYDGDEYYKLFKKKVKKVCLGYHKKDVVCMDKIKSSIVKRFTTDVPTEDEDKYRFNYFVNSALASIIIYYNSMVILKYDKTYQNLFTNNFRIFKRGF